MKNEKNGYNLAKCLRRAGSFQEAKLLHQTLKETFNSEQINNELLLLELNQIEWLVVKFQFYSNVCAIAFLTCQK